ncbi:DUF3667 domain-containing protein [Pedobacter frigiditerrae]|uniref:DUF3667 domain-containing protein n=1 Tax=Pedobacter frigiditerrae TaxID=2530452 RepID=UPI00292E5F53|nr:DUF3667 domain-containing protein [Pedobacter frigiditerrae]
MKCNNCGATVQQNYCGVCGQKVSTARLHINELFHDGWHAITHTDKGLLRLLKDLVIHPRSFYANYFNGQRKKYFSPILFFILTAGAVALLYGYVFAYQDKIFNTNNEFGKVVFHETKFKALLILPVQILLSWIAFRKYFNLAEVAVFWLFTLGLSYCLRIVAIPLYFPLIAYKDEIDLTLFYLSYLLILWQGLVLFGKNFWSIVGFFIILNISIILDSVVSLYILFGEDIFDNPMGVKTWWDLIKMSY